MRKLIATVFTLGVFFLHIGCRKDDHPSPSMYAIDVVMSDAMVMTSVDDKLVADSVQLTGFLINELNTFNPADVAIQMEGTARPVTLSAAGDDYFDASSSFQIIDTTMTSGTTGMRLALYDVSTNHELRFSGIPAGGTLTVKKFTMRFMDVYTPNVDRARIIQVANAQLAAGSKLSFRLQYLRNNLLVPEPK